MASAKSGAILLLLMIVMNAQGQIDPTCTPELKCLVLPVGCTVDTCKVKVTIKDKKGENLKFKTEVKGEQYGAVAVSKDMLMPQSFGAACHSKQFLDVEPFLLSNRNGVDTITQDQVRGWFKGVTATTKDGVHSCDFEIIFPINDPVLNITKDDTKVHILLAIGDNDATGNLKKHEGTIASEFMVGGHGAGGDGPTGPGGPAPEESTSANTAPEVTPGSGTGEEGNASGSGDENYLQQSWTAIFVLFVAVFSAVVGVSA